MQQIPDQVFEDYQAAFGEAMTDYEEYYEKGEDVRFDPWTDLPKATLITLFGHILGEEHHLVQEFRDAENPDEDVLHDLQFEIPYIKFAYGVKHGYVTLDDNWYTPHMENYSQTLTWILWRSWLVKMEKCTQPTASTKPTGWRSGFT